MKLIAWTSIEDKKKLLKKFDPKNSFWIVSDIKSHAFVLEHIQKNKTGQHQLDITKPQYGEQSVWRAPDFWKKSLLIARPKITVLPRALLIFIYQEWAKNRTLEWQRGWETGSVLCRYMEMVAHLLEHPLKENLIAEWQSEKKGTKHLSKWQSLSQEFWEHLNPRVEEKITIEESWVSAFLIDKFPYSHFKLNQIVFDLGFEIDQIEAELITQIANKIPTKVLVPSHLNQTTSKILSPAKQAQTSKNIFQKSNPVGNNKVPLSYKTFVQQGFPFISAPKKNQDPPLIKIKKWTTPLAEVKDISSYVGGLLQKGVPANKISVIAPQIEDYWIFLKSHFEKENIPVNKSETSQLISFYESQLWLSTMWTHLSVIQYENMEALFAKQNPYQNFSQLKSEFYNVQEKEHYPPHLYKKHLQKDKNQVIKASEFVKWALALLPEKNLTNSIDENPSSTLDLLKKSLNHFTPSKTNLSQTGLEKGGALEAFSSYQENSDRDFSNKISLPYASWLKLLERFLKFKEITIKKEEGSGINCLSFNALSYLESDFVYIAGLSEQSLKTGPLAILSSSEADFLTQSLGFFVKCEPLDKMEQLISHFIKQNHQELVLSFATSNFEGLPLSPSFFWLKKAKEQNFDIKPFSRPQETKWDKQQQEIKIDTPHKTKRSVLNINPDRLFLIKQAIKEDQGKKERPAFLKNSINKLTVSLLEDYTDCPFIFLVKKHFGLWDGTDKNMDISPLEKGILIHKLFEIIILKLKKEEEITKNQLSEIIEQLWTEQNQAQTPQNSKEADTKNRTTLHPLIWEKEKARLLKKALRFLEKEKANKVLFKNFEPLACEKKYNCYWDLTTKSLAKTGDIAFEGKIDRIDSNQKAYHVIDYKGQLKVGSAISSWLAKERFQMAVYAQVVQQGLADLPALPVLSALYLSYKDFKAQGMALKQPAYIQLLGGPKKKSLIPEEKKQALFQEVNQQIQKVILNMQGGHFSAKPKVKKLCETCRWQKMCRAPHLN